jgi:prepilin-type N-terminal cleavage/methylation domain-containing protein
MSSKRSFDNRSSSGFSLIEVLVALTILGVVLLFSMSLLAQEPRVRRRLAAHREALEVLETVHEEVRAGMRLSLTGRRIDWQRLDDPPRELAAAEELAVWAEVVEERPVGLYRVTLRARYFVAGQPFERSVETMIWRP